MLIIVFDQLIGGTRLWNYPRDEFGRCRALIIKHFLPSFFHRIQESTEFGILNTVDTLAT